MGDRLRTGIIAMQKATAPEGVYGVEYDAVVAAARRVLDARPPDYEAAAMRYYDGDVIGNKPPYWSDCTLGMKTWYRDEAKAIVDAAVGGGLIVDEEETR